jgi:cell division protein FtsB
MSLKKQLASVTLENRLRKEAHARLVAVLPKGDCLPAHEQVAALVAENQKLRAENESRKKRMQWYEDRLAGYASNA